MTCCFKSSISRNLFRLLIYALESDTCFWAMLFAHRWGCAVFNFPRFADDRQLVDFLFTVVKVKRHSQCIDQVPVDFKWERVALEPNQFLHNKITQIVQQSLDKLLCRCAGDLVIHKGRSRNPRLANKVKSTTNAVCFLMIISNKWRLPRMQTTPLLESSCDTPWVLHAGIPQKWLSFPRGWIF